MNIYGDLDSGNCLKVKYVADYLGLSYRWIPVDIMQGQTRTPDYLRINPMAQIPAVEFEDGRCLAQSNAILRYLASGSDLLPNDAYRQAKIDEMLFWEQYSHEPYIAVCRFEMVYRGKSADQREAWRVERGEKALDFMQDHLRTRQYLVMDRFSIADIALLAYTRLAPQGGFDLGARSHLRQWIERCEDELDLGSVTPP
ncbi:glutathione S-transferase family protein [Thioalkalivibrio sp. HK1]|uniref:glutathione S-transferase family protein n=1 Tax=Thioalkalivibrio sp. HK1 TaxID=1469245 RepID=UPI0004705C4E|nr:glutathione S-transferase family protein [Thioalkalivibrio sp. HK1]